MYRFLGNLHKFKWISKLIKFKNNESYWTISKKAKWCNQDLHASGNFYVNYIRRQYFHGQPLVTAKSIYFYRYNILGVRYFRKLSKDTIKMDKGKKTTTYQKIYSKFRPDLVASSLPNFRTKTPRAKSKDNLVDRAAVSEVKVLNEPSHGFKFNNDIRMKPKTASISKSTTTPTLIPLHEISLGKEVLDKTSKPGEVRSEKSNALPPTSENLLIADTPPMATISDLLHRTKFTFKPETRSDIPLEANINKMIPLVANEVSAPVPAVQDKSDLKSFMDKPKVDIKSLKSFKRIEESALRLNPLKNKEVGRGKKKPPNVPSGLFSKVKSMVSAPVLSLTVYKSEEKKVEEKKRPQSEIRMSITQQVLMEKRKKPGQKFASNYQVKAAIESPQNAKPLKATRTHSLIPVRQEPKPVNHYKLDEVKDVVPVNNSQTTVMLVHKEDTNKRGDDGKEEKLEAKIKSFVKPFQHLKPEPRETRIASLKKFSQTLGQKQSLKHQPVVEQDATVDEAAIRAQIDDFFKQSEALASALVNELAEAQDIIKDLETDLGMENVAVNEEDEEVILKDKEDIVPQKLARKDTTIIENPTFNFSSSPDENCENVSSVNSKKMSKIPVRNINEHPLLMKNKKSY